MDDFVSIIVVGSSEKRERLERLVSAARQVEQVGLSGDEIVKATEALADAMKHMEEGDLSGASETVERASEAGRAAIAMIQRSRARIAALGELAAVARSSGSTTVSFAMKSRMSEARRSLTTYDRAKLTRAASVDFGHMLREGEAQSWISTC